MENTIDQMQEKRKENAAALKQGRCSIKEYLDEETRLTGLIAKHINGLEIDCEFDEEMKEVLFAEELSKVRGFSELFSLKLEAGIPAF